MRFAFAVLVFIPLAALAEIPTAPSPRPAAGTPQQAVEDALRRAGKNRPELEKALADTPADRRAGMAFLLANMPDADLAALKADFLLENLRLAYDARAQVPWGRDIPDDVFFNNVLPYANVNESRDPWRKELYELSLPIVKACKTPAEAAMKLNATLFEKLKVKYSTERRRADQSPKESIETGKASCTGLSILLSDACRSVCVPTRIVGTPLWANKRGNHTWVEIWDKDWHFTGACEQDPAGLDRGWFVGDASQALKDSPQHAIYAASFKKTDLPFPLVWAPGRKDISAENVTDRYAKAPAKSDKVTVSVRVWQAGKATRAVVPVVITDAADAKITFKGESKGETADRNDILTFDLPPGREFTLKVGDPARVEKTFKTEAGKPLALEIELPAEKK